MLCDFSGLFLRLPETSWDFLVFLGLFFCQNISVLEAAVHCWTWTALFTLLLCSLLQNRQSKLIMFFVVLVTSQGTSLQHWLNRRLEVKASGFFPSCPSLGGGHRKLPLHSPSHCCPWWRGNLGIIPQFLSSQVLSSSAGGRQYWSPRVCGDHTSGVCRVLPSTHSRSACHRNLV